MSFSTGLKEYIQLNKGLITEATPLTFPEDATLSEENFIILDDGSRARRHGLDMETVDYTTYSAAESLTSIDKKGVNSFTWTTNSSVVKKIVVVQVGNKYTFFNGDASTLGGSTMNSGNSLTLSGNTTVISDYTVVNGDLIVCNNSKGFYKISYNDSTGVISKSFKKVKVRDIWGVNDGLKENQRPSSLSQKHKYNLRNQGWPRTIACADYSQTYKVFAAWTDYNPLSWTKLYLNRYPANTDVIYTALVGAVNATEAYWPTDLNSVSLGDSDAPKGRFIIDLFSRGQSRNNSTDVSGMPADTSSGGVTTAQFFAGRLWIACTSSQVSNGDSKSPDIGSYIYFSQVVDNEDKLSKFYQEGDPTSRDNSDIIDSDGGALKLPGVVGILALKSTARSLLVFAENGIWEISGGESNFSATNLEIRRVTEENLIAKKSFVAVDNNVFYWGESGINLLSQDDVSGAYASSSITDSTIKSFYKDIPTAAKENAVGKYDVVGRKVLWLYNGDSTYIGPDRKRYFNKELVLDLVYKAFTLNTFKGIDTDFAYIAGYAESSPVRTTTDDETVTANSVDVTVNSVDVTTEIEQASVGDSRVKYLTMLESSGAYVYGFSEQLNPNFKDWERIDGTGIDAAAFMVTGYDLFQDTQKEKQTPYLTVHMNRERDLDKGEGDAEAYLVNIPPPACGITTDSVIYALSETTSEVGGLSTDSSTNFSKSADTDGGFNRYGDTYLRPHASDGVEVSTDYRSSWTNVPVGGSPSWGIGKYPIRIPGGFAFTASRKNPFPQTEDGVWTYIDGTLTGRAAPYSTGDKKGNSNATGFSKLIYRGDKLYALNSVTTQTNSAIRYSTDLGSNWDYITSSYGSLGNTSLRGVPYYGNDIYLLFVRTSTDGATPSTQLMKSTDGIDWTMVHADLGVSLGFAANTILGTTDNYYELAYANDRWLMSITTTGLYSDVYESTDDGSTWSSTTIGTSLLDPEQVHAIDNTFYFYDNNPGRVGTSCDGVTWSNTVHSDIQLVSGFLATPMDGEPTPTHEP